MKSAIAAMSPRMSKGLITPRLSLLLTPRTRGNLNEAVRATMPEGPNLTEGPLAADASILERASRETPMGMTREQLEGARAVILPCIPLIHFSQQWHACTVISYRMACLALASLCLASP